MQPQDQRGSGGGVSKAFCSRIIEATAAEHQHYGPALLADSQEAAPSMRPCAKSVALMLPISQLHDVSWDAPALESARLPAVGDSGCCMHFGSIAVT